jgi:arylsulfatase A-like enzyme
MYEELLRVPFVVVNGPPYLGEIRDELVSLLDVPPLIHDAIGEKVPDQYEGRLLKSTTPREYVVAEHQIEDEVVVGSLTADRLYEYNGPRKEKGLFKIGSDTFESLPEPDLDNNLKKATNNRIESINVTVDAADLDADVEDRLSDLGYI